MRQNPQAMEQFEYFPELSVEDNRACMIFALAQSYTVSERVEMGKRVEFALRMRREKAKKEKKT